MTSKAILKKHLTKIGARQYVGKHLDDSVTLQPTHWMPLPEIPVNDNAI